MASVVRWPGCQNSKDQSAKRRSSPHGRGRTPGRTCGARGASARPSPGFLQCPRERTAQEGAESSPARFPCQNHPPEGRRRIPGAPAHIAGSQRRVAALGRDQFSRRGPRSGWSRIRLPAVPWGRGRATLSPRHPEEPAHSSPSPHLSRIRRDSAPALRERGQRRTVEQRSGDLAWSNRTRTPEREWGLVEKRRRRERELQKIPKPASLPPVGPSRHRFLPKISFPAAARGKIRAAHAAP